MKGFVTLATGNIHYYHLAYNLVKSYKCRNGQYPFAILCDRKNEYTDIFDDIIILNEVQNNYLDKFRILIESPYDENFFIETDCLIYRNIDNFWDFFANSTDLSSFGWNDSKLDLFLNTEEIKSTYHIDTAPMFCPGYMYIKKGEICSKIYNDALEISEYLIKNMDKHPKAFLHDKLRDDPVFFLAMKLNNCSCAIKPKISKCIHYPSFYTRKKHYPAMNFINGYLEDDFDINGANLCHFSTKHTKLGKYHQQVIAMNCYINGFYKIGQIIEARIVEKIFIVYYNLIYKINMIFNMIKYKND